MLFLKTVQNRLFFNYMANERNIFYILIFISAIISVMPLVVAVFKLKYIRGVLLPIFLLTLSSLLTEGITKYLITPGQNNLELYHIYTIIEFILISLFYILFFRKYFNSILISLLIPVFFLAAYIDYKLNGLKSMDNFSTSLESIIFIFYSISFFYYALKNLIFENLLSTPLFWLNTAILIYFSGNLILFVFSNYMAQTDPVKYGILWAVIHTFFNVLYNVLLSVGFWKAKNR